MRKYIYDFLYIVHMTLLNLIAALRIRTLSIVEEAELTTISSPRSEEIQSFDICTIHHSLVLVRHNLIGEKNCSDKCIAKTNLLCSNRSTSIRIIILSEFFIKRIMVRDDTEYHFNDFSTNSNLIHQTKCSIEAIIVKLSHVKSFGVSPEMNLSIKSYNLTSSIRGTNRDEYINQFISSLKEECLYFIMKIIVLIILQDTGDFCKSI